MKKYINCADHYQIWYILRYFWPRAECKRAPLTVRAALSGARKCECKTCGFCSTRFLELVDYVSEIMCKYFILSDEILRYSPNCHGVKRPRCQKSIGVKRPGVKYPGVIYPPVSKIHWCEMSWCQIFRGQTSTGVKNPGWNVCGVKNPGVKVL